MTAASVVTADLPVTQAVTDELDLQGHFVSVKIGAQRLDETRIAVHFESAALFYAPQWANPLWQQLGFPLTTEREQILRALRLLLLDLPVAHVTPALAFVDVEALPTRPPVPWTTCFWQETWPHGVFSFLNGSFLGRGVH